MFGSGKRANFSVLCGEFASRRRRDSRACRARCRPDHAERKERKGLAERFHNVYGADGVAKRSVKSASGKPTFGNHFKGREKILLVRQRSILRRGRENAVVTPNAGCAG